MRTVFLLFAAAATSGTVATPAPAEAKPRTARCVLDAAVDKPFRGPCLFLPEKGGSFTIEPASKKVFFGDVTSVSVTLVKPGLAEVRGLTVGGINSRWGEARRSPRDRACWKGADFSVCAY